MYVTMAPLANRIREQGCDEEQEMHRYCSLFQCNNNHCLYSLQVCKCFCEMLNINEMILMII